MYKEYDEDGQMNLDTRLDSEAELDANIDILVEFAYRQLADRTNDVIKNRYEGYGKLAQEMQVVSKDRKALDDSMKNLLGNLAAGDSKSLDEVLSIDNALTQLITDAVYMAATVRKVSQDMENNIFSTPETTPLEEMLADGFEESEA